MELVDELIRASGPGAIICAALFALFARADNYVSQDFKDWLSLHLLCLQPPDPRTTIWSRFGEWFDRIFGTRKLSWRFFLRSCIASFAAYCVVFAVAALFHRSPSYFTFEGLPIYLGVLIVLAPPILFNFLPDYVSLMQTRMFVGLMRNGYIRIVAILLLDFCLSVLIFMLFAYAYYSFLTLSFFGGFEPWREFTVGVFSNFLSIAFGFLTFSAPHQFILSVLTYTSLLTSVWLWVYVAGILAIRTLARTGHFSTPPGMCCRSKRSPCARSAPQHLCRE